MRTTRRRVLRGSATAAALGLAGCTGFFGGGNDPEPRDYQYDPSELLETENKFFGLANYAQLYEAREYFPESTRENFENQGDSPIPPEDIGTMVGVGGAQLSMEGNDGAGFGALGVLGSFEKGTLESSIEEEDGTERTGEYEGFTLYETTDSGSASAGGVGDEFPSDGSATVAAGEGTMIAGFAAANDGNADVTGDQATRTMIDAGNGEVDHITANSDHAADLENRLGENTVVLGGQIDPGLIEAAAASGMGGDFINGIRAGGFGMNIDGETTTMTAVGIYEDAQAAEDSGVVELVDFASSQFVDEQEGIDSVDSELDGSAVVVTVEGSTETIFEQSGGTGSGFSLARPEPTMDLLTVPGGN